MLQGFLKKELPAVPLKKRLRIKQEISTQKLKDLIAELLAKKITAITFINQPETAENKKDQVMAMMLTTIYHDQTIEWAKVRLLLAPFDFKIAPELDEETKKWLQTLKTK